MKPKTIGIIGGAGPLAGALLLERVLRLSQTKYGCYRDGDFPKVILLSFPFSEMLTEDADAEKLGSELKGCINDLKKNGSGILAIACNTLHAFLDPAEEGLISLPRILSDEMVKFDKPPLVLCTSTSKRFNLHKQSFPCSYPNFVLQLQVDRVIDRILKGDEKFAISKELVQIIGAVEESTIVLGCTELSLFADELSILEKRVIDPLEFLAQRITKESFSKGSKK